MASGLVDAAAASQYADLLLTPAAAGRGGLDRRERADPVARRHRPARTSTRRSRSASSAAMLELNEPENRALLAYVYGPDGYVRADPAAFDGVRAIARRYGFLS